MVHLHKSVKNSRKRRRIPGAPQKGGTNRQLEKDAGWRQLLVPGNGISIIGGVHSNFLLNRERWRAGLRFGSSLLKCFISLEPFILDSVPFRLSQSIADFTGILLGRDVQIPTTRNTEGAKRL